MRKSMPHSNTLHCCVFASSADLFSGPSISNTNVITQSIATSSNLSSCAESSEMDSVISLSLYSVALEPVQSQLEQRNICASRFRLDGISGLQ